MAYGTGNEFEEIAISLEEKHMVLVTPPLHVATAEAYAGVTPQEPEQPLREILEKKPIPQWKGLVNNDFEPSVFSKYPAIADIKDKLYQAGATYASMSGSGATVYGIFDQKTDVSSFFPADYLIWQRNENDFPV